MRGKAKQQRGALDRLSGITPAYAGKRTVPISKDGITRDHPRLCGEKQKRFIQRTAKLGSPPPMRGKGLLFSDSVKNHGITPAYAGKSRPR